MLTPDAARWQHLCELHERQEMVLQAPLVRATTSTTWSGSTSRPSTRSSWRRTSAS